MKFTKNRKSAAVVAADVPPPSEPVSVTQEVEVAVLATVARSGGEPSITTVVSVQHSGTIVASDSTPPPVTTSGVDGAGEATLASLAAEVELALQTLAIASTSTTEKHVAVEAPQSDGTRTAPQRPAAGMNVASAPYYPRFLQPVQHHHVHLHHHHMAPPHHHHHGFFSSLPPMNIPGMPQQFVPGGVDMNFPMGVPPPPPFMPMMTHHHQHHHFDHEYFDRLAAATHQRFLRESEGHFGGGGYHHQPQEHRHHMQPYHGGGGNGFHGFSHGEDDEDDDDNESIDSAELDEQNALHEMFETNPDAYRGGVFREQDDDLDSEEEAWVLEQMIRDQQPR